jgi:transposase-like protein
MLAAAKRFFRKALAQPHTVNPRTVTVDKNPAYPKAIVELKEDGELWHHSRLRQSKYLNNIVEQTTDASSAWFVSGSSLAASKRLDEHWLVSRRWQ